MRITVGGVLFLLGAGAAGGFYVASSDIGKSLGLDTYVTSFKEKANESLGLFNSASGTATPTPFENLTPAPVPTQGELPLAPTETPVDEAALPIVEPTPTPLPVVAAKKKVSTRRTRRKKVAKPVAKKTVRKPAAKTTAAAAAPAAAKQASGNSLIGSYVNVALNTGNTVKGILKAQTATSYSVELPGLGEFTYPVQNVKSITRAE